MYDDLAMRLRDFAVEPRKAEDALLVRDAADAIEELSKLALDEHNRAAVAAWEHRWIPVSERLPEAGERVLCYCRANIYEVMKMRTDGDWVYDTNHIYMHSFVTHWMPLPQPPQAEEGET